MQAQDIGSKAFDAVPSGASNILSRLKELADQGRTIAKCQHILKSLEFRDLRSREQMITDAHESTFTWIFQEKRLGFVDWAAHKNGIFWVTGKPGSGKSTLMKYLVNQPRTYEHLRRWAGTHRLGVASHYFWNPGTAMQKSESGLLRKLLYDIVRQFPTEALEAIPPEFEDTKVLGDALWTVVDLRKALEAFGKNEDLGTKFCFFIDGLDEYHSDHEDLVECLSRLSRCPSLKLCVSSRPWNVFSRAYNNRAQGQLAVQELTRGDIKRFIDDRMNASEPFRALQVTSPQDCTEILTGICEKAQGVFLWVHLVLRSLLRGLHDNDDSIDILRQRLQEYPDTLDGYFDRMFQRIEKVYKKQSARILLVALASVDPLPLRTPSYIEQEMRNSDYARGMPMIGAHKKGRKSNKSNGKPSVEEKGSTAQSNAMPMLGPQGTIYEDDDMSEKDQHEVERTRRCIDARCGDLLEINGRIITFLHRTARDFLEQEDILKTMRKLATDDFDAHLSMTRLCLAQMKSVWPKTGIEIGLLLTTVLAMENKISEGSKPFYADLLMEIDKRGDRLFKLRDGPVNGNRDLVEDYARKGYVILEDQQEDNSQQRETYGNSYFSFRVRSALIRMGRGSDLIAH
ncbi:hypothetical protein EJ04DRAFT_523562 [Polyplosphaeria fusca]|uniref:NACHT domain-containing protein n=1 Tax=Polyplosphaeria fusca TaxID=682080 RepID=A0A9P4UZT3_9PLEO|nr:hypothetical protein EJ04DRAFT_523562 [Polyplosphaeria fusca]